jgi:hypothetical protein
MHIKSKLSLFVFFAGLIFMATFYGTAGASEFFADVVMKGGMVSGDGKLWIKGQKSRQEMGAGAEKMIIIMVNKSDMMGEVITDLQNSKKASARDELFIVSSGYQEMPSPQMPQMPGKKQ